MGSTKKYNYRIVGFGITPHMDKCIRMYALSQNITITKVLRSTVRAWIDSTCVTVEILMDEIVSKAVREWDKQKFVNQNADLDEFRKAWRKDLMKKLPSISCDEIVEEFNRRITPNETKAATT